MFDKPEVAAPLFPGFTSGPAKGKDSCIPRDSSISTAPPSSASSTSENPAGDVPMRKTSDTTSKLRTAIAMLGVGVLIGAVAATTFIQWGSRSDGASQWGNKAPFVQWGHKAHYPYAISPAPEVVPEAYSSSMPLDNSCLIPHLHISVSSDKPQTFDACGFVIQSTDEVWNLRGDVDAAINKYFHEDYIDAGSWGRRIVGKKALRDAVFGEMRAFPDIKIHITDCVCQGNDIDGYKCAMPDILEGTNLGPSAYGPPTGRYARWSGMVQSLVKRNPTNGQWQYWAEWGVHDEWALIQQLGLDFSRVPHPVRNLEQFHDCAPLVRLSQQPTYDTIDTAVQQVQRSKGLRAKSL